MNSIKRASIKSRKYTRRCTYTCVLRTFQCVKRNMLVMKLERVFLEHKYFVFVSNHATTVPESSSSNHRIPTTTQLKTRAQVPKRKCSKHSYNLIKVLLWSCYQSSSLVYFEHVQCTLIPRFTVQFIFYKYVYKQKILKKTESLSTEIQSRTKRFISTSNTSIHLLGFYYLGFQF